MNSSPSKPYRSGELRLRNRPFRGVLRLWPALLASALCGCAFTAPYRTTQAARTGLGAGSLAVVTFTEAEHRPGKRQEFFADTRRVLAELPGQEGLLGYSFRFELFGNRAWTMTAWVDEAARDRFVRSPAHLAAMRNSRETTQSVRFYSLEMPVAMLPPRWSEAVRLLSEAPEGGRADDRGGVRP